MAINTSKIAALLRPGLNMAFADMEMYPYEWLDIYKKHTSDKQVEYDVEMKMLGLAQMKTEGGPVAYGEMEQRFITSYLHQYVGLGFIITRQALLDNLYKEAFPKATTTLKDSLMQYKNIQAASTFNNAFNSAFPVSDGQPLCSTSHPVDFGMVSNTFSVPAQLNETSLEDALIQIQAFQNAAGLLVNIPPKFLLVPPALQFTADRLLESKYRTATANNDINAIYNTAMLPQGYRVNHFLTSPTAWFIINKHENGFKYFEREPLSVDTFVDIDTDNLKVRAIERYSFGCSDFRATFGTAGA